MKRAPVVLFIASALVVAGPAPGQDKTAALDKARTRFEADIAKAEEALLASLDKALAKAGGNKQQAEKLQYERELFVSQRVPPASVPSAAYVKQRAAAIAALEGAYMPVVREFAKADKAAEADALETALGELVKTARGYGIALPALEARPALVFEHKASGMILDVEDRSGFGKVLLSPKAGKRRVSQVWQIEREPRGVVIRNLGTKDVLSYDPRFGPDSQLRMTRPNPNKDTPDECLFKLTEQRRLVAVGGAGRGDAPAFLTTAERKLKGVTLTDAVFEKSDGAPKAGHWWVVTEAK